MRVRPGYATALAFVSLLAITGCKKTDAPKVQDLEKSVGRVVCPLGGGRAVTGTGFVVDPSGLLITNQHVIEDCIGKPPGDDGLQIHFGPAKVVQATIEEANDKKDLAVLRFTGDVPPALTIASGTEAPKQSRLTKIGFPGTADRLAGSNRAWVEPSSAVGSVQRYLDDEQADRRLLQIDVLVNEGDSGGPVFDACGRVAGVSTLKVNPLVAVGINAAVASSEVVDILNKVGAKPSTVTTPCDPDAPPRLVIAMVIAAGLLAITGMVLVLRRPATVSNITKRWKQPDPQKHAVQGPVGFIRDEHGNIINAAAKWEVRILEGPIDLKNQCIPLAAGASLVIGRDAGACALVVPDEAKDKPWPGVSKRHLELRVTPGGALEARELEASRGTKVNGVALRPGSWTPVQGGATIELGSNRFSLRVSTRA
ncbi:MAG: hypothetical protein AMXMBFR64_25160 [Myxococcales bacterium]